MIAGDPGNASPSGGKPVGLAPVPERPRAIPGRAAVACTPNRMAVV